MSKSAAVPPNLYAPAVPVSEFEAEPVTGVAHTSLAVGAAVVGGAVGERVVGGAVGAAVGVAVGMASVGAAVGATAVQPSKVYTPPPEVHFLAEASPSYPLSSSHVMPITWKLW